MFKVSQDLSTGNANKRHQSNLSFQFLGALLLTCLSFGLLSLPVSAMSRSQMTTSPALSIPKGTTPAGWKTVHYQTTSISVPASWPVYNLSTDPQRCALLNIQAVYLGHQGPNALCPAHATGKSDVVQLEPIDATSASISRLATTATTIAGVPAQVDSSSTTSHTFVTTLSQAGVLVSVSYGLTSTLARQILGTLQVSGNSGKKSASQGSQPVASARIASGTFSGQGFDTCSSPSIGSMSAWLNSPYRAIGVYIGGANRGCPDGNLSSSWVSTVTSSGWNLMPYYVGLQAPCVNQQGLSTIDPNQASLQGTQAADDAVSRAQNFGLGTGTLLIFDMEAYSVPASNPSCRQTVITFLSAWATELQARNYLSGVYSSLSSGVIHLVNQFGSMQEPTIINFAEWDGIATTNDPAIPDGDWVNQRIKQYLGGRNETYAGVTINIDNDQLDATLKAGSGSSKIKPAPTLVTYSNGTHTLFALGNDGHMWWSSDDGSGNWNAWNWDSSTNYNLVSTPVVVTYANGRHTLFAPGSDGHMFYKADDGLGNWNAWNWDSSTDYNLAAVTPTLVTNTNGTHTLFALGSDGHMFYKADDGLGNWNAWNWDSSTDYGLTSTPVVVTYANGRHTLFAPGSDGHMFYKGDDGSGNWNAWNWDSSTDYNLAAVAPTLVTNTNGTHTLFALGSDGHMFYKGDDGSGNWNAWNWDSSTNYNLISTPAVVTYANGRHTLFAPGTDGHMFYKADDGSGNWNAWNWDSSTDYGFINMPPTVVSYTNNTHILFVVGSDHHMFYKSDVSGSWNNWNWESNIGSFAN